MAGSWAFVITVFPIFVALTFFVREGWQQRGGADFCWGPRPCFMAIVASYPCK